MTLEEVYAMARQYQVEFEGLSVVEIIRKIQLKKGQFDCFATAYDGTCKYAGCCLWRDECFVAANMAIYNEFR